MYAATGYQWSNPNLSFSYAPDGTNTEGYISTLFTTLDAIAPRDVWQREFARALQTWANVSNLNFHEVADSGVSSGAFGSQGDVRLTAHPLGGYLAYAYFPGGGIGGDIMLATEHTFRVGADYDLYSVLLHEAGHSLGLDHTSGTVMNSYYQGILGGLTADDVAGIRSMYGARSEDALDAAARNDSFAAATVLTLDSSGLRSLTADLTSLSDVDYFRVTAPTSSDGTLRVNVDARDISLLHARVQVYDAAGTLIGAADAPTYEGLADVTLSGMVAGQTYYVVADGAVTDAFGMGKYKLSVAFGGGSSPPTEPPPEPPPPTGISADRYEPNNTLDAARNLGKFNSRTETALTLHSSVDDDFFRFTPKNNGTFQISTQFATSTGQHEIRIYDSQKILIAVSSSTNLDVALTARQQYFVQIGSPSGTLDTYNLVFERSGAIELTARKQLAAPGDGYLADAASAAHKEHDSEHPSSAVDRLLASWLPEQSSSGTSPISTVMSSRTANWQPHSGQERNGVMDLVPIRWSQAGVNQIFERLGSSTPDAQSETLVATLSDDEALCELALRLN